MANSWDNAAKFAELAKLAGLEVGENGVIEANVTFSTDELNELIGKIIDKYTLVVRPEMTAAATSTPAGYQSGVLRPPGPTADCPRACGRRCRASWPPRRRPAPRPRRRPRPTARR